MWYPLPSESVRYPDGVSGSSSQQSGTPSESESANESPSSNIRIALLASMLSALLWKPTTLSVDRKFSVTTRSLIPISWTPLSIHSSTQTCPLKSKSPSGPSVPGANVISLALDTDEGSIVSPVIGAHAVASSGVVQ